MVDGVVRALAGIDVTGTGTTEFVGGTIEVGGDPAGGRISVAPGGSAAVGSTLSAGGLVKVGGGRLTLGAANAITGAVTVEAGELVVASAGALNGQSVAVNGGRMVVETAASQPLTIPGLSLNLAAGGGFDVGTGRLEIAAGGMAEADLRSALVAGRNGGGWDGPAGIGSAAAGGGRAVGYLVGDDGSMTVAFAAPGDVDLNGTVDVFDLVGINTAGSYGGGQPAVWDEGDFNYDGAVNVFDLVDVEAGGAFNQGNYLPAAVTVATVPEPSLLALALSAGYLVRRRRRR